MSKYIIFISDDFGMTHSINRGIINAMTDGVVTATNFTVPTPWFNEAINLARQNKLPVGIHLNITCEWENYRWRPMSHGKTICDTDGTFFKSYKDLMDHASSIDIYNEYKCQIEYLLSLNWQISHIDSHMLPPVFNCGKEERAVAEIVEKIAKEYNLIYLYGCENGKSRYFDSYYEKSGKSESDLYEHLSSLEDGFHLVVTHSSVQSDEQKKITNTDSPINRWAEQFRIEDLSVLKSDRLKEFLIKNNFTRITVPELSELIKNKG